MKLRFFCKMLVVGLLGLSAIASAHADSNPVSIGALQLKHIPQGLHNAVTVFYANGRPPAFAFGSGNHAVIRAVLGNSVRADVRPDGSAKIPAAEVPKKDYTPFNYIVILVHSPDKGEMHIKNTDATVATPDGAVDASKSNYDSDSFDVIRMITLPVQLDASKTSVTQIDSTKVQGHGSVVLDLENQ